MGFAGYRGNENQRKIKNFACNILFLSSVLSSVLLFIPVHGKGSRNAQEYDWTKGDWGNCEGTKCGDGGVQLRSVTCVYSPTMTRTINSKCINSEKPKNQRLCFKVCAEHQGLFRWKTSHWQQCQLHKSRTLSPDDPTFDSCGLGLLQLGVQHRNVSCVSIENENKIMDNYICETFSDSPSSSRACDIPCPQNCVLTEFGDWTECSSTCGTGTQNRVRSVIVLPRFGGIECDELSETRPCPNLPACPLIHHRGKKGQKTSMHSLKFDSFQECVTSKPNLEVIQRRKRKRILARINSNLIGKREQQVSCLNEAGIALGNSFTISETCSVKQNCELSAWSEWGVCYSKCGQIGIKTRSRRIMTLPSNGAECDVLEQKADCNVDDYLFVPCKHYTWVTGGWSDCDISDVNSTCGGGVQYRDVYCIIRDEFTLHQASTASQIGSEEGTVEWAKMQPVEDSNCDQAFRPPQWQNCNVKCLTDCRVSQWTVWSKCAPEYCENDPWPMSYTASERVDSRKKIVGFKRRFRSIINVDNNSDYNCPHIFEVMPCIEPHCATWQVTDVLPCEAYNGLCGTGSRKQNIECRSHWGHLLNDSVCLSDSNLLREPPSLICHKPCGSDCVISDWSNWTPCSHMCRKGRKESGVQHRFREILANAGPNGVSCLSEEHLREQRPCNQHRCSLYYWDTGPWSTCLIKGSLPPETPSGVHKSDLFMSDEGNSSVWLVKPLAFPYSSSVSLCGVGYKTRSIVCKKKDSGNVPDKFCGSEKPATNIECTLPCKRDCVVSQWSKWSSCEDECDKMAKNGITTTVEVQQHRQRYIVQHRSGSGLPCSIEMAQKRQCVTSQKCMLFKWQIMKWSPCITHIDAKSIYGNDDVATFDNAIWPCFGLMTRQIECHQISPNGDIRTVDTTYCVKYSKEPIPSGSRTCSTKCQSNMNFLDWIKKLGCQAVVSSGNLKQDEKYFSFPEFDDSDIAELQKTSRPVGDWSSCNITTDERELWRKTTISDDEPYCGTGTRTRALGCFVDETDIMVDNSYCSYRNFQEESCEIPCPIDCRLSDWGEWGECGILNTGGNIKSLNTDLPPPCGNALKMRFQYLMSHPQYGGRACPVLDISNQIYERQSCVNPCEEYFWISDKWNQCEVKINSAYSNCGEGVQARSVSCHKILRSNELNEFAQDVPEMRLCDIETMPFGSRKCHSACPGECVFSEWSSWSGCNSCDGGTRSRIRQLLRQANVSVPIPIPSCQNENTVRESEKCKLNVNCFVYRAQWSQWSSCFTPNGATCGIGKRERRQNCISSLGLPVHEIHCNNSNVHLLPPEFKECNVPCDIDCQVTKWSQWSDCSMTCGINNTRQRNRQVKRQQEANGRDCPILKEITVCAVTPCFKWVLADWSDCQIHGAKNCGNGLQLRSVKCHQHDGLEVPSSLCMEQQNSFYDVFSMNELQRDCNVACAGECHLSQWSSWSSCHAWCTQSGEFVAGSTDGVQTSSRVGFIVGQVKDVDCPLSEVIERSCDIDDATCYKYEWATGSYVYGHREVWCEQKPTNMNVSSGCYNEVRPQDTFYCVQDCAYIKNSFCMKNGICGCQDEYKSYYEVNGVLLNCDEPEQMDQADVINFAPDVKSDVTLRKFIPDEPKKTPIDITTTTASTATTTTNTVTIKHGGFLNNLEFFDENGKLKVWVYGVIAGLVVFFIFLIAIIYLIYASCCRKRRPKYVSRNHRSTKRKKKRRNHSSGSNVGVGYYDPGIRYASNTGTGVSYGSSRSGFSYPDQYYDSDG